MKSRYRKGWQQRVQEVYSSMEELRAYDEVYDIVLRVGYGSVEELWDANPMMAGSTNPADLRIVKDEKSAAAPTDDSAGKKVIEGLGRKVGDRHQAITSYDKSWAADEAKRPKRVCTPEEERFKRAGIVHPDIQNAVKIGEAPASRFDDMGLRVGHEGMRRFATNAPGEGGGGPGSTAGVLLGRQGYDQWARDMRGRGETVPLWHEGQLYGEESVTPSALVDRLIEAGGKDEEPQADVSATSAATSAASQPHQEAMVQDIVDRLVNADGVEP